LLCLQYYTPDDGQKTCPKHVEFYSKNKFEKLVDLVGFIIIIIIIIIIIRRRRRRRRRTIMPFT